MKEGEREPGPQHRESLTLFAAVSVRTRYREVMHPLLLLPLVIPLVVGAVRATTSLLTDAVLPLRSLQLLLVTDAVYLIISFIVFEFVLDE